MKQIECQLMVQAIEAWLLADPASLASLYRQGFHESALAQRLDVEQIPKDRHLPSLEAATKDTQKGRYHKVRHLSPLLYRLNMSEVRRRSRHCDRIFVTLGEKLREWGHT